MGAELSRDEQGVAEMFSVLQTPWHKEGHILTEAPSFEAGLELAGLNYEVVKRPTKIVIDEGDEMAGRPVLTQDSKLAYVTFRTDTMTELGMVGPGYSVVQNHEAFEVMRPLIDSGHAKLETGGSLRDGADAWLMLRWNLEEFGPVVRELFADGMIPFGLIAANHSGRRGILLQNTVVRVVCANTLGMAESSGEQAVKVIHTGDARQKLIDAAESLWGGIIERYEVLAKQYNAMRATILTDEQFAQLVLAPVAGLHPEKRRNWNPEARMAVSVVTRYEEKIKTLTSLWTAGKGHTGDKSAWEAYNGVVECLDHDEAGLWPTRGGVYRTASLLNGSLRATKTAVLDNLVHASADAAVAFSA